MGSFGYDEELLDYAEGVSPADFKAKVNVIFSEYLESGEVLVCIRRILDLDCEAYDDELAVIAIHKTLDSANDLAATLLQGFMQNYYLDNDAEVAWQKKLSIDRKRTAFVRGIEKILSSWESLVVDVPHCLPFLVQLIFWSVEKGLCHRSTLSRMPEKLVAQMPEGNLRDTLEDILKDLPEFKKECRRALKEFFGSSNSVEEIIHFLTEQGRPQFHHEFVRLTFAEAITQRVTSDTDIQNAVHLLGELLDAQLLVEDDLNWGFLRFLGSCEDLIHDCPQLHSKASEICGQLLSSDLLSSAFVYRCRLLRIGQANGADILTKVARDFPEHYRKSARGGAFKKELRTMIIEFYDSSDPQETKRILQELSMNNAMRAEFVRKLIFFGLERSLDDGKEGMRLLSYLMKHEELTEADVKNGFEELEAMLPDLGLDLPHLAEHYQHLRDQFQLVEE